MPPVVDAVVELAATDASSSFAVFSGEAVDDALIFLYIFLAALISSFEAVSELLTFL